MSELSAGKRGILRLLFVMGLRVATSVCYIGLIAIISKMAGANQAAQVVYLFAVSFVSSNLGRFGADQQISKWAVHFRRGFGAKAGSLVSTHALFSVTTVPLIAALIHAIASSKTFGSAQESLGALPFWVVVLCAAGLALAQTVSAAWQASGYQLMSIVVFPLTTYVVLAALCIAIRASQAEVYVYAFILPGLIGLGGLVMNGNIRIMPARFTLLKGNSYFYSMGMSFYIAVWLPFIYLPGLLSAATIVTLNLAVRLSSIQSMPSNAIAGYLMPQFALQAQRGEHQLIEKTMQQVIAITMLFQLVYIGGLAIVYWLFADVLQLASSNLIVIVILLSLGQIANGMTGPVGPALLMLGQQKIMATLSFLFCIAGAALGYIATAFYGAAGFAGVTALVMTLQNLIYIWLLHSRLGLNPYNPKFGGKAG